jgi:hypothetical protein
MTERTDGQLQAQTMMEIAEIVATAYEVHASRQSFGAASQSARAANQMVQALAEGGVEPLDKGRVDHAFPLRSFDQALHHFFAALHNMPLNRQEAFNALLDDLHDGNIRPRNHLAATCFASSPWQWATT